MADWQSFHCSGYIAILKNAIYRVFQLFFENEWQMPPFYNPKKNTVCMCV